MIGYEAVFSMSSGNSFIFSSSYLIHVSVIVQLAVSKSFIVCIIESILSGIKLRAFTNRKLKRLLMFLELLVSCVRDDSHYCLLLVLLEELLVEDHADAPTVYPSELGAPLDGVLVLAKET